jgi:Family of unknown function (DUF6925)
MSDPANNFEFLAAQMADPRTSWSLGTFGAIAEFTRDADEPLTLSRSDAALAAVTGRGGIRIEPPNGVRLFASENTTRDSWNHRIAVCLRKRQCAMNRRTALTELGPDSEAMREQDREGTLFDLGLGALQVDVCVRVADADVAAELRSHAGRVLFDPSNPAISVILAANPHRIFMSQLGRIEVYQPIPPADGKSLTGPHTHILPKLLHHRRTHAATELVPEGWIPCGHLYPAHPAKDALGRLRPFDPARHLAFQKMLQDFGDPRLYALKQQVVAAVAAGEDPSVIAIRGDRMARTSIRVALRQLKAAGDMSPSLMTWLRAHERPDQIEMEEQTPEDD